MDIHYKKIEHERLEDAPFVGALISAVDCKLNCKGCFNRDWKKEPTYTATAEDIIKSVKSNPFNEGIILAGLEWSMQPLELVELCKVASENALQVIIYTGHDLGDFTEVIGKNCAKSVGLGHMVKEHMLSENDTGIYSFIGSLILDYYMRDGYYIKTGNYQRDKLSPTRERFGVKLATSNQRIYKIVPRVEEKDEHKIDTSKC